MSAVGNEEDRLLHVRVEHRRDDGQIRQVGATYQGRMASE